MNVQTASGEATEVAIGGINEHVNGYDGYSLDVVQNFLALGTIKARRIFPDGRVVEARFANLGRIHAAPPRSER